MGGHSVEAALVPGLGGAGLPGAKVSPSVRGVRTRPGSACGPEAPPRNAPAAGGTPAPRAGAP